jgi:uncharacterized Tic20 family protein
MLAHLAALAVFTAIPFGNIIGPLVVFLIKKDEDPFVAEAGKESLNFQITFTIEAIILLLGYVVIFFTYIVHAVTHPSAPGEVPWFLLIIPALVALAIFDVISIVVAAVRTYNGERFRYPLAIPFIR